MEINIRKLLSVLAKDNPNAKLDDLVRLVLESIALKNDSILMTELMLDVLKRNAKLNRDLEDKLKEIKRLSVTDQLTGIYNRRKFLTVMNEEIERSIRYERSFSIIMFDIDHFKHVNDTFGHDAGDYVLQTLSSLIGSRLRPTDIFARWGGEEFMILTPETNLEQALFLAEKLRALIEEYTFSIVDKITSSFGVVSSSDEIPTTIESMTKAVDLALYESKQTGRNKVTSYNDLSDEQKSS